MGMNRTEMKKQEVTFLIRILTYHRICDFEKYVDLENMKQQQQSAMSSSFIISYYVNNNT